MYVCMYVCIYVVRWGKHQPTLHWVYLLQIIFVGDNCPAMPAISSRRRPVQLPSRGKHMQPPRPAANSCQSLGDVSS